MRIYLISECSFFFRSIAIFIMLFSSFILHTEEFTIGVLYWSMNIKGQVAMRMGLEEEMKKINQEAGKKSKPKVNLIVRVAGDGEAGIKNQIKQMYELIGLKPDLIIVQPTDNAALVEPLIAANKSKIPVVAYDQYISDGELAAYRTSDNYQAGYLDGEYIASLFENNRIVKLIMVEYPHVSSTVERVNGFLDALSDLKQKYEILKTYSAVEPVSGKKAGNEILKDFPKRGSVDVVFTVNDGGGLSVVDVLANAGRDEIKVATIDGDPASIENIKSGRLTVIDSAQFCGALGAETLRASYNILMRLKVPYHALIPVFPITKETMKKYSGWLSPIPKEFLKPWESKSQKWIGNLRIIKE